MRKTASEGQAAKPCSPTRPHLGPDSLDMGPNKHHRFKACVIFLGPYALVACLGGFEVWGPCFVYAICNADIRTPDEGAVLRAHGLDCRE